MRLVMVGGGGFRTPLVYGALAAAGPSVPRVEEVVLYDVDAARLAVMEHVLSQLPSVRALERMEDRAVEGTNRSRSDPMPAPRVHVTTDLDRALEGADVVFSAVRVGGLEGRVADERVALDLGVLGQETTGPGGIAFGLRTIPVALQIAERVRAVAPDAWVLNFTNPAGMITEAMQAVLGDRVVGICDTPITMAARAARLLGVPAGARLELDYVGLNHLGWLRGLRVVDDGADRGDSDGGDAERPDLLPSLLADDRLLAATEEGQLFGLDWVRTLGALPNEYLYYYAYTREAVAALLAERRTRGEFLADHQRTFYSDAEQSPGDAFERWTAARARREETYMAAERQGGARGGQQGVADVGGYEGVALALMRALVAGEAAVAVPGMVLNVRGRGAVPGLPDDAVVEVPVEIGPGTVTPRPQAPPTLAQLGLMQQVKAVERLTIEAAVTGSPDAALQAFATHPLVDSVSVARSLLAGYRARIPQVDAVLGGRA